MSQWLRARDRLRRRPIRFRWLRFLLLVLAFSAATVALAGPSLGGTKGPRSLAVLLDASASMGAQGGRPLAQARARIEQVLATVPAHVPIVILVAGAQTEILSGTRRELLDRLPTRAEGVVSDLAELAGDFLSHQSAAGHGGERAGNAPDTALLTITDGLGKARPPTRGALFLVGAPADNLGLTGITLEDRWPLAEILVRLEIANFGSERTVILHAEGAVEPVAPVMLPMQPMSSRSHEFSLRRAAGGTLRLWLTDAVGTMPLDALEADDEVRVEIPAPPTGAIAVRADVESGPWIVAAARALAAETGTPLATGEGDADVAFVLVDGGQYAAGAEGPPGLLFGSRQPGRELEPSDLRMQPALVDLDREHALTRGLDLSELRIGSALAPSLLGPGRPLLVGEDGPLAVLTGGRRPSVRLAFRLADSNFPVLAAFPQFVRRAYAASFPDLAAPRLWSALLDADESRLQRTGPAVDRALPRFAEPARSLVVPLLLLALLALGLRLYL